MPTSLKLPFYFKTVYPKVAPQSSTQSYVQSRSNMPGEILTIECHENLNSLKERERCGSLFITEDLWTNNLENSEKSVHVGSEIVQLCLNMLNPPLSHPCSCVGRFSSMIQ